MSELKRRTKQKGSKHATEDRRMENEWRRSQEWRRIGKKEQSHIRNITEKRESGEGTCAQREALGKHERRQLVEGEPE